MRDLIDVIGDGGAVIEHSDLRSLELLARRLREYLKSFPWRGYDLPMLAAGIKVNADTLDEILARIEASR